MSRWNINTSRLVILSCLIFLMLLILYLPDVDLPDAAFHGGTAPVVVHAHATGAPVAIDIVTPLHAPDSEYGLSLQHRQDRLDPPHMSPNFRPILLRSIRC
ncbi:MAG TPA: hypothetical protein VM715_15505 [Candidatus Acidoferrum sp.]|jgi:hypothetical protein|nr:hypothetical protein [Candidatus Acidoferrum sp.]